MVYVKCTFTLRNIYGMEFRCGVLGEAFVAVLETIVRKLSILLLCVLAFTILAFPIRPSLATLKSIQ